MSLNKPSYNMLGQDLHDKIGDLSKLNTTDKTSVINAINEVYNGESPVSKIGDLTKLTTSDKTDLVSAINDNASNLADIITLAPNGTNDTSNMQAILDAGKILRLQPKTYNISSINLNDNAKIMTAGFETTIQQISGQSDPTRVINILGSNVIVEDMTIIGNIATDIDEQYHGIFINPSKNISNIKIGNIYGKNIRGDVIDVAGLSTATVKNVKIGKIFVDNVLRNGISITGGEDIRTEAVISMGQCGYAICDVEPNANSQYCDKIYFGYVKGRQLSVGGGQTYPVGLVEYGTIDLDPAFQSNCNPTYASFTGLQYAGFTMQNFKVIHIDVLRTNNFNYRGMNQPSSAGDYVADELVINRLEQSNCSLSDPSYNSYNTIGNITKVEINGGNIQLSSASKYAFINQPNIRIKNLVTNGTLTYNCINAVIFDNVTVNSTYDVYVATGGGAVPMFINCKITFTGTSVGRLCGQNKAILINCTVTVNNFLVPSGNILIVTASTLNGVYYSNGVYNSSSASQGYTAPIQIGPFYLWVSPSGTLRIKNGAPTSDTDGVSVGSQT